MEESIGFRFVRICAEISAGGPDLLSVTGYEPNHFLGRVRKWLADEIRIGAEMGAGKLAALNQCFRGLEERTQR